MVVRIAADHLAAGQAAEAAAILDALIAEHPDLGALRADRAVLAMLEGAAARRPRPA